MMRWHLECGRGFLVNDQGTNALMAAARAGSKRIVKLCLRWKFDMNTLDYEGGNVLHYCAESVMPGANTVLTYLLTHGALDMLNSRDYEGYTPLARAVKAGAVQTAKTLGGVKASLEGPSRSGMSLIHIAASRGRSEMLKSLLSETCFYGRNQEDEKEFAQRVIEIAESKDRESLSALHHSCFAGLLRVVSILVDYGVNVDLLDEEGRTPLHYAVCSQKAQCIELLLSGSADPSILDNLGMSPLHHAAVKNFGPEISALCRDGRTNTEQLNRDQETALHCASISGNLEAVEALCACAADTNHKNPDGDTPLHLAAQAGHADVVKVLLEYNANPNGKNYEGETALGKARMNNRTDVINVFKSLFMEDERDVIPSVFKEDSTSWERYTDKKTGKVHFMNRETKIDVEGGNNSTLSALFTRTTDTKKELKPRIMFRKNQNQLSKTDYLEYYETENRERVRYVRDFKTFLHCQALTRSNPYPMSSYKKITSNHSYVVLKYRY